MGVNIPLSAQATLIDIATLPVNHPFQSGMYKPLLEFVPMIEDGLLLLLTPAARTMTRYMDQDIPQNWHLWNQHYEYQHQTLQGGPLECEVLTIANGSRFGNSGKHNFSPGELLVQSNLNNFLISFPLGGMLTNGLQNGDNLIVAANAAAIGTWGFWQAGITTSVNIRLHAVPDMATGTIYESAIYVGSWWTNLLNGGLPVVFHIKNKFVSNLPPIDNAPGGFVGDGSNGLVLENLLPPNLFLLKPTVFKLQTWCFTPTFSVLNYHSNPQNNEFLEPYKNFGDNETEITSGNTRNVEHYVSNSESPVWNNVSYKNTAHTWFTNESSRFMHFHLIGKNLLPPGGELNNVTGSFNYGKAVVYPAMDIDNDVRMTKSVLTTSLTVTDNQFLGINIDEKIGSSLTSNQPPFPDKSDPNSSFLMTIGEVCNLDPITVIVENGATFVLGDDITRTGACHVMSGNTVIIRSGSELVLNEGSTFKLREEAKLIIEDGGKLIIHDRSALVTEYGSIVEFHDGAEIQLLGNEAVLDMTGKLVLKQNALFNPKHVGVNSGQIIVRNPTGWLQAENGSSVKLLGDGNADLLLSFEDNGRLQAGPNMLNLVINDCKVVSNNLSQQTVIQSYCNLLSNNVQYVAGNEPFEELKHPLIQTVNFSQFSACDFVDCKVLSSPSASGKLNVYSCNFNYTYKKTDPQITAISGGYNIANTTFNNFKSRAVYSDVLTLPSAITSCQFSGDILTTVAVEDFSDINLRLNSNSFEFNNKAVKKTNGKLTARCNEINYVGETAFHIADDCYLELGVYNGGGYNVLSNIQGPNITLENAQYAQLSAGYNIFDATTYQGPIVYGSVQIGYPQFAKQYMHAKKNTWTGANPYPDPADIDIWSSISGANIPLVMIDPSSATCGTHDPVTAKPIGVDDLDDTHILKSPNFMDVPLLDAVMSTLAETEIVDTSKNDLVALDYFKEILTADFDSANVPSLWLCKFAEEYMKEVLHNTFSTGRIEQIDNIEEFHHGVQNYVNVLNTMTVVEVNENNYTDQFYLEMNKAHLFYLIGNTSMALDFLYSMENCGLDYKEQNHLNKWKYIYETELVRRAIGPDAYSLDTVWVDTSNYMIPVNQEFGNFGSFITDPNTVVFNECSSPRTKEDLDTDAGFVVKIYPNPNNGLFMVSVEFAEARDMNIEIVNLIGQKVFASGFTKVQSQTINFDLNHVAAGVYFVNLQSGDDTVTRKIVVR